MGRLKAGLQRHALRVLMPLLRRVPAPVSAVVIDGLGWINYKLVPGQPGDLRAGRPPGARGDRRGLGRPAGRPPPRLGPGPLADPRPPPRRPHRRAGPRPVRGRGPRPPRPRPTPRGEGVILLGNHFGSHLHPSHWLYPRGLSAPAVHGTAQERLEVHDRASSRPTARSARRSCSSRGDRRRPRPPARSSGPCGSSTRGWSSRSPATSAGRGPHTAPAHFLGSTYLFSTTWVVLAAMTGRPVVPVFCRPDGRGRYILEFLPVLPGPHRRPSQRPGRPLRPARARRRRRAGPPPPRPEQRLLLLAQARDRPDRVA